MKVELCLNITLSRDGGGIYILKEKHMEQDNNQKIYFNVDNVITIVLKQLEDKEKGLIEGLKSNVTLIIL